MVAGQRRDHGQRLGGHVQVDVGQGTCSPVRPGGETTDDHVAIRSCSSSVVIHMAAAEAFGMS